MDSLRIYVHNVDVDLGLARILSNINLSCAGPQHFAVLGDNGAGKTTLLRLLTGELWPSQRSAGQRLYELHGQQSASPLAAKPHMRLVTPQMADWYQLHDLRVPVWEVICAGLTNTPFLYHQPSEAERDQAAELGQVMGVGHVLHRPVRDVSTGEAKRTLLDRALIIQPKILAVDELGQGLDRQGQLQLLDVLNRIAESGQTRLIVSGHGVVPVPEAVQGRIYLEHGRITDAPISVRPARLRLPSRSARQTQANMLIQAENCSVVTDGVTAIRALNWTVHAGECWAVLGHNGAGKSSLLQMITGYRRPWPGGVLTWFEQTNQFGLAAARARLGILAPWIKERIDPASTCKDIIFSGLCDGLGMHRGLSAAQKDLATDLAQAWGMRSWLDTPLSSLSYGQARQVMLARSVVHGPDLLVLDEPFSGLDVAWQARMQALLADMCAQGRTVVMATHSPELSSTLFSHALVLESGTCAAQGAWDQVRLAPACVRLFGAN
ncbi:MAG: ATP-binding cassette domain-containing protein [Desulfovibrionales bacterium]|nr:ATP-binding cassette domain-containing protein [Desulfovibrionales bacterium]